MNANTASRTLLLERLESRCLLAGGLLSHAGGAGPNVEGRNAQSPIAELSFDPGRETPQRAFHQPSSAVRPMGSPALKAETSSGSEDRSAPAPSAQPEAMRVVIPLPIPTERAPAAVDPSAESAAVPSPGISLPTTPGPQDLSDAADVIASGLLGGDRSATTGSANAPLTPPRTTLDDPTPRASGSIESQLSPSILRGGSYRHRGLIEIPRVSPDALNDRTSPEETSNWNIRAGTLRRLKALASRQPKIDFSSPPETAQGSTARRHDLAIESWFSDRAGLIRLDRRETIFPSPDSDFDAMVDVILDATLGMNRRIDVITKTNFSQTDDGIRDAVLAAIQQEQSPHTGPPNAETNDRFSALIVPGALLAAGTLAVANRRRRSRYRSTSPTIPKDQHRTTD